jgi:hypothetical protein
MHPLVRDLYKRALVVGRDYPLGIDYVRRTWKDALRNPSNCPSCYDQRQEQSQQPQPRPVPHTQYTTEQEKEIRKAVGKGRYMIREMIGVIQLKKYRSMKRRYDNDNNNNNGMTRAASAAAAAAALEEAFRQTSGSAVPNNENSNATLSRINGTYSKSISSDRIKSSSDGDSTGPRISSPPTLKK